MSPLRELVDSIHVQVAKIEDDMKVILIDLSLKIFVDTVLQSDVFL